MGFQKYAFDRKLILPNFLRELELKNFFSISNFKEERFSKFMKRKSEKKKHKGI